MPLPTKDQIMLKLKEVEDPELRINVADLGLIYGVDIDDRGNVEIDMTLTAAGCPYGEAFRARVESKVKNIAGVEKVKVNLVFDPPWDPVEMASDYAKDELGLW